MPANGRWDLIRRLKVNGLTFPHVTLKYVGVVYELQLSRTLDF